jgi:hypothetical protein
MIFYRFKGKDDLSLSKYGKSKDTLIPNELKTEKEINTIKSNCPKLNIDKTFEKIDIPKSGTYTNFGVRFQNGYNHNGKTESIKKGSTKMKINEAESYGWVVEDYQAQEAYEFACDYFGEDELNSQIVSYISNEELASCLAYIFRMNEFREWDKYLEGNNEEDFDESCKKKSKRKTMKEYADELHGIITCNETGEEYGYNSYQDREYIISDLAEKGYTYKDRPVRVETGYTRYDDFDESVKRFPKINSRKRKPIKESTVRGNYYSLPDVKYVWNGEWADPGLIYNGKYFNAAIVEDSLWDSFRYYCEETGIVEDDEMFNQWISENKDEIYEYINALEEAGEYEEFDEVPDVGPFRGGWRGNGKFIQGESAKKNQKINKEDLDYSLAWNRSEEKIISKLNNLTNVDTFWDDVRKLTKNVHSDRVLHSWEIFSEKRYNELCGIEDDE